jgi:hypothetical protein
MTIFRYFLDLPPVIHRFATSFSAVRHGGEHVKEA